ncbi:hypothetical protein KAT36_00890 [Candidatus Pacearchaeota archaeon]|nr:hypothetical protein [Candidatus Pacearchaeota archaeon]
MSINLIVLGLSLDFFGVAILILVTLFGTWHQKVHTAKWSKKYYWEGRIFDFRKFPPRLRKVLKYGFIPPKHMWNSVGFLLIGLGFLLQIIGNLR